MDISQNTFHNPQVKLRDESFKPTWIMIGQHHTTVRVNETGGNRSGLKIATVNFLKKFRKLNKPRIEMLETETEIEMTETKIFGSKLVLSCN